MAKEVRELDQEQLQAAKEMNQKPLDEGEERQVGVGAMEQIGKVETEVCRTAPRRGTCRPHFDGNPFDTVPREWLSKPRDKIARVEMVQLSWDEMAKWALAFPMRVLTNAMERVEDMPVWWKSQKSAGVIVKKVLGTYHVLLASKGLDHTYLLTALAVLVGAQVEETRRMEMAQFRVSAANESGGVAPSLAAGLFGGATSSRGLREKRVTKEEGEEGEPGAQSSLFAAMGSVVPAD